MSHLVKVKPEPFRIHGLITADNRCRSSVGIKRPLSLVLSVATAMSSKGMLNVEHRVGFLCSTVSIFSFFKKTLSDLTPPDLSRQRCSPAQREELEIRMH